MTRKVTNQQKTTTPQSWHNQVFETAMKMSLSSRNHTNFVSTGSLDNSNHTLPIMVTSWLSHYLKAFLQGKSSILLRSTMYLKNQRNQKSEIEWTNVNFRKNTVLMIRMMILFQILLLKNGWWHLWFIISSSYL